MDSEKPAKYYGYPQVKDKLDLGQFASHITSHGCVYSEADIQAILLMATQCIKEQLLAGNVVSLGDLGTFSLTFSNKGSLTAADFSAENIKAVKPKWRAGKILKDLRNEATFNVVPQKKQTDAVIQGSKAGKSTVTI